MADGEWRIAICARSILSGAAVFAAKSKDAVLSEAEASNLASYDNEIASLRSQ